MEATKEKTIADFTKMCKNLSVQIVHSPYNNLTILETSVSGKTKIRIMPHKISVFKLGTNGVVEFDINEIEFEELKTIYLNGKKK